MAVIVDATVAWGTVGPAVVVAGSSAEFQNRITKNDGTTYDLTGKTVTVSIRAESAPDTVINAQLEDVAVTLGNDTYTAAQGGVRFALSVAMSTLLGFTAAGEAITRLRHYLVQYKVVSDNYMPDQVLRFAVRRIID